MNTPSIYKSPAGEQAILSQYTELLKRWPTPCEATMIDTRHGQTFVMQSGDPAKPPLILLHGTGSNSAMWLGDAAEFGPHYRVYAVDIIGEPGKSASNRPDMRGPQHTEWLEDVVNALHLATATFVTCSLGGWMALKFATIHPERVARLVLLCPSGVAPAKLSFLFKAAPLLMLGEWGIKRSNRLVYGKQPIPPEAEAFGLLVMKHFQPRFNPIPVFSDDELRRLTMPVLLLAGAQDALLPSAKTAARLRQLLPQVETRVFPESGHVLLGMTPTILTFLRGD